MLYNAMQNNDCSRYINLDKGKLWFAYCLLSTVSLAEASACPAPFIARTVYTPVSSTNVRRMMSEHEALSWTICEKSQIKMLNSRFSFHTWKSAEGLKTFPSLIQVIWGDGNPVKDVTNLAGDPSGTVKSLRGDNVGTTFCDPSGTENINMLE